MGYYKQYFITQLLNVLAICIKKEKQMTNLPMYYYL